MSVGLKHILGIKSNGTLWSCGKNGDGQLGLGTFTNYNSTVTQVGTATNWVKVSAGVNHTFAINDNSQMYTWGLNDQCEMGILNGQGVPYSDPTLVTCGPLSNNEFATSKSGIYPNPSSSVVSFTSNIEEIALYTLDGKQINIALQNNQIDVSQLPTGIYLIKGKNTNGSFSEKLIKR